LQQNVLKRSDTPLSSILETYYEATDFFGKSVTICVQLVLPSWTGCGLNHRTNPNGLSFTYNCRVHQQSQHFIRLTRFCRFHVYWNIYHVATQTEHPALYIKAHASCQKVGGVKEVRTSASTVAQTVTLPTFILGGEVFDFRPGH